jgi:hypothetical protein
VPGRTVVVMRLPTRPRRLTLVLITVAGVVLAGLAVADHVVGRRISDRIAESVGCRLDTEKVDVDLGGWPNARAALSREISAVDVHASGVVVDQLPATPLEVDLALADVRRGGEGGLATSGGSAHVDVPLTALGETVGSDLPVELEGADGMVVATIKASLMPVTVTFDPEVAEQRLRLEPVGISVAGRELSGGMADRLLERAVTRGGGGGGALPEALGEGVPVPLPPAVTLDDVTVRGDDLSFVLEIPGGDDVGSLKGTKRGCT